MRSGSKPFIFLLCMSFWLMINGFPGMAKAATETTLPIGQPTLTERSLEDRTYFALNVDKDKDKDKDKDRGRYTLTVNVSPPGAGSVSPGSGTYPKGTKVQLTAKANSGYAFDYWTGDAHGSRNPVTITMDHNETVQANFKKCKEKKCKKNPHDCEDED